MLVGINAQKAFERETGIGNYAANLFMALAKIPSINEQVLCFLLHGASSFRNIIGTLSVDSVELSFRSSPTRILWEQMGLPIHAKKQRVDLLHYVDHALPILFNTIPTIITVHDLAFYRLPQMYSRWRRLYKQTIGIHSIHRAAHIIAISNSTKQDIMEISGIGDEKITVIPYGISEIFRPLGDVEKEQIRLKYDLVKPFFLFVGTIQPRKNLQNLFSAFARLSDPFRKHFELVIAGGIGWLMGDLIEIAGEYGIGDQVRTLGPVPHSDMPALYNAATALVYPSWYEGFGLPPLEAMACGVPVICSNSTSLPEVVGNAALLVSPSDVEGLVRDLIRVANDTDLRYSLQERGIARAALFSWDTCARRTFEIYEKIFQETVAGKNAKSQ